MSAKFEMRVRKNKFAGAGERVHKRLGTVVRKVAFDAKAITQSNIRNQGLIKTGNLFNSVSVIQNIAFLRAYVVVGAYYAIYLELGTVHMTAKPFLGPAIETVRGEFNAAVGAAIADGIGGEFK